MAGPEAIVTALVDFFVVGWPVMSIGAVFGILFSWYRWVPSKWAFVLGSLKRRSYGVLKIRLKSKKFHNEVVDFGTLTARTKYGAFNHTKAIIGYEDGVPIAAANQTDTDSVPLFRNDYPLNQLNNPVDYNDALEAAFIAGQIANAKEDKRMFILAVLTLVAVAGVGFLIFDQRSQFVDITNRLYYIGTQVAGSAGGGIVPGGTPK